MSRLTSLFARLVSDEHLERAARSAVRGKRRRPDVAGFELRRQRELDAMQRTLVDGTWRHGPFDLIPIRDPKPRLVARAAVRDRVVHSALGLLLEPELLRSAEPGDLACRKGAGTHRAHLRLLELLRRSRFVVHLDFRSYFPSIDPSILREQLRRRVADERFLEVLDGVLARGAGLYDAPHARRLARMDPDWPPPGRGLPIGAVTSQLLAAHLYPVELDRLIHRRLRVKGYVRYVDDLFVFGDRRADLRAWRREIRAFAEERLALRLKHPEARVLSCAGHLDALGMRLRRSGMEPVPRAWRRWRQRVGTYVAGERPLRTRAALERSLGGAAGTVFWG